MRYWLYKVNEFPTSVFMTSTNAFKLVYKKPYPIKDFITHYSLILYRSFTHTNSLAHSLNSTSALFSCKYFRKYNFQKYLIAYLQNVIRYNLTFVYEATHYWSPPALHPYSSSRSRSYATQYIVHPSSVHQVDLKKLIRPNTDSRTSISSCPLSCCYS